MSKIVLAGCVAAMLAGAAAQDVPMPKPQKQHEWLQQIVGEWDCEGEFTLDPAKSPVKTKGTESARMIGGFWALAESKGDFMGSPFNGVMILGYDTEKNKYVGTWVDSMTGHLWIYEGTLDGSGKILTLETEGPCPGEPPGQLVKVRDIIEIRNKDTKIMTSKKEKDGKWETSGTLTFKRKK